MADIARVTEITARSNESFEAAIRIGLERASRSLRNVQSAWIKDQKVDLEDGRITSFQVNMLVTFVLDDEQSLQVNA